MPEEPFENEISNPDSNIQEFSNYIKSNTPNLEKQNDKNVKIIPKSNNVKRIIELNKFNNNGDKINILLNRAKFFYG